MVRFVLATALLALALAPAVAAEVTYYDVPRGAHPHDVAPAADGKVFYTAQSQGALGILDPKTGKVTQVSLGNDAAPHGVIVGPDRAAWITEGGQNAIARVDPVTLAVKLFPLPKNFEQANLNTATFDRKGILWFTGQNGVYGRVDPASGKVDAWKAPKGVGPYGITTTPNGDVWYASLAGDHIAKIDTVSGDALMVPPPKPGVGPRRIWSDSKGLLWVSFWNSGEIGRFDPAAKAWKVWSLPKSKEGCYAVYVDDQDKVWVSDWGANALVRFDPVTEKFESFPSSRRSAAVRQILGRKGEVWAANPAPTGWWWCGSDRISVMTLDSGLNRRDILRLAAGGAIMAAAGPSEAGEARIEMLIAQAHQFETISQRIDFISAALRGTHYRGYTLIGGPRQPEQFVLRDDGFDCVTFCETVLAAAIARDRPEFEAVLREIRYHNGVVNWFERNHYFFEWGQHNIENKTCRAVAIDGSVALEKTVYWHRALGRRTFAMQVVPRDAFLANKDKLAAGDIVGFVTQRPNLDYFHVGFIAFGKDDELLLRHAALSRHRVLDERMDRFVAQNRVRYVTLLRPQQPAEAVAVKKG